MWLALALATLAVAQSSAVARASTTRVPYLPVPRGAAVILDTGSTNASGYRIVVQVSGSVEYVSDGTRAVASISPQTARAFFADLATAAPLDNLMPQPCMKSVSFGTGLFIWWSGHGRSPDLRCPTDEHGAALRQDADAIAHEIGLSRIGAPLRPLMPGEQHRALPPAPSPNPTSS